MYSNETHLKSIFTAGKYPQKPRKVPNSRKLPLFYLVFFVVMIMSHVGVQKQQGNIVTVCGNFPANTGFHRAHIINSFLNTVQDKLVGTHSVSLSSQCWFTRFAG